jgi:hypothetical protein
MAGSPAGDGVLEEDGGPGLPSDSALHEVPPAPDPDAVRDADRRFFMRVAVAGVGALLTAGIAWGVGFSSTVVQIAAAVGGLGALLLVRE